MAVKARYDGREDRMLLMLENEEGGRRALWITRRQWLNLYAGLGPLKPEKPEGKPPAPKGQPLPQDVTEGAERVDSIRLARKEGQVQVGFVVGESVAGVSLAGDTLERFKQMVLQQAERAGWDPHAAAVRLRAAAAADAALRKAQG